MIKRNIPNTITLGNLFCGCLAILKIFEGDLVWASYLVGIAAVLDFFDGMVARMLKVTSPIGKDLDSLADMVTFGVVPGLMIFKLAMSAAMDNISVGYSADGSWTIYPPLSGISPQDSGRFGVYSYLAYCAFLIPIFSAIRLAKFNNDTRQTESFIGLPTPANAILISSFPLILEYSSIGPSLSTVLMLFPWIISLLSLILSLLLVAPIPLFSLKFKQFKWKGNEVRYSFLLWAVVLMSFLQFAGIPLTIISYVLFSLVNNLIKKRKA
jgi:CDP-diacylglycerol--serine O-phosphatidyltransferase